MANTTITALPAATTPLTGTEVVPIVQSGVTKKVAVSAIGGGGGSVTAVTGTSPVVSSGGTAPAISLASGYGDTLNPYASKTANFVLAAPTGAAGVPTFRAIVAADIPTLNQNTTGTAAGLSATLAIASGGTGQTTANAALNGLLPSQSGQSGKVLSTDGTNTTWTAVGGTGTVTSVALSAPAFLTVSGSPITASGTLALSYSGTALPVANGGTGATTATAAFDALAPTQTGNSGKYLTTNGSTTSWATVSGSGTVTSVAQTFTGGIVSVGGSPITSSGTLALTVTGTSGGIPYFSSGTTWASSSVLTNNALMIGGGAGAAPATIATGTGVIGALGTNVGSAGAFVANGGDLGTPSSGTVTNLTGTANININGTVGASTPTTGIFTTATARSNAVQDFVALQGRAGGTNSYGVTLTPTTLTASRTLTLPDASGTILQSGTAVTVAQGGTGATTAISAFNALAPSQSGNNGKYLTTDGTNTSWATVSGGGSPGGSNTQIQFNNSSAFGGSANLTWDGTNVQIGATGALRFADTDSSNYVAFKSPGTVASNVTWTLPSTDGTSGQVLSTNGSGVLSWVTVAPATLSSVEYLVVGGGGGGGLNDGGGGGAGGYRTSTSFPVSTGVAYTVTVGSFGAGSGTSGVGGSQGSASVFSTISASGGGGGGSGDGGAVSTTGGSGGGGGNIPTPGAAGNSGGYSPSEGNSGGAGFSSAPYYPGGGGGGSGATGGNATSSVGGSGGAGTASSITGSSVTYAGGGGGGTQTGGTAGSGGSGIGGAGGSNAAGGTGSVNTGSGGGGNGNGSTSGGNGGSGVVIIAYPDTYPAPTSISGGLTYNQPTRSGYRVYRFTAGTGTITF